MSSNMNFEKTGIISSCYSIIDYNTLPNQGTEGTGNGSGNDVTDEGVMPDVVPDVDSGVMRLRTAIGENYEGGQN